MADVLGKAVEAGEQTTNVEDMVQGLKLTQTQLLQVFGRHGLAQITPQTGETKFDPNLHEALFQVIQLNQRDKVSVQLDAQYIFWLNCFRFLIPTWTLTLCLTFKRSATHFTDGPSDLH